MSAATRLLPKPSVNSDAGFQFCSCGWQAAVRQVQKGVGYPSLTDTDWVAHPCRLSTNTFLAVHMDTAMSSSKTLLLAAHRCLQVFLMRTAFVVTDVSLWKGEYPGTEEDPRLHHTFFDLFFMLDVHKLIVSALKHLHIHSVYGTCTQTSTFKAIYTDNILAGLSTNTGNNLSFH